MTPALGEKIKAANAALLTEGRPDAVADFFAADYTVHLTDGALSGGHEAVRGAVAQLRRAFPSLRVEVEILVEHGDRVAWQRTLSGVQQGAFQGFPATARPVRWREQVTSRFHDGLIAEEWLVSDLAERLLRARKKT